MLLITPYLLAQILCPGEYKSFFTDMFPSVPERTRRNLKNGAKPSKKTLEAIISDLASASSLSEQEIRTFLTSQSPQPWKNAFAGFKKGSGKYYHPAFDYSAEIVNRVESVPFKAAKAKQEGSPLWLEQFKTSGLPSTVMPDSFLETLFKIGMNKKKHKKAKVVPIDSGKVLLRTNLFILAALEVSLMNSDLIPKDAEMWVHKMMPYYRDGNLIEPMREFFEVIMEKLEIPSVAQFAQQLPPLTLPSKEKNIDSQKRQIHRWISGNVPPSWENIRLIRDTFFEGTEGLMISYGVVRFLQSLLMELRDKCIPTFFANEEELISIFQEYPKWQKLHQKGFAEWNEARGSK